MLHGVCPREVGTRFPVPIPLSVPASSHRWSRIPAGWKRAGTTSKGLGRGWMQPHSTDGGVPCLLLSPLNPPKRYCQDGPNPGRC